MDELELIEDENGVLHMRKPLPKVEFEFENEDLLIKFLIDRATEITKEESISFSVSNISDEFQDKLNKKYEEAKERM